MKTSNSHPYPATTDPSERRRFLGWMAGGAMMLMLPGLTACGGGGGSETGTDDNAGDSAVAPAARAATLAAVSGKLQELDGEGLSRLELVTQLAAYMATQDTYAATGVDEETLCAWGIFNDGRLHVVANNVLPDVSAAQMRRAGDLAAARTRAFAMQASAPPVELPSSRHARILHAFGADFPQVQDIVNDLQGWMALRGYRIRAGAEGDARISTLRSIAGDGFVYIHAHGGAHPYDRRDTDPATEKKLFSIQSSTPVSEALESMPDIKDDLDNLRLTYFTAATGQTTKNWRGKEVPVRDTRYGITANFVTRYWRFPAHSTVFINACFSANPNRSSANNFIAACHQQGAGVYLGWTHVVSDHGSSHAPRYLVDRMLGANQYQPESPQQRAFAWDKVMQDMQNNGHDRDAPKTDGGPTAILVARKNPNQPRSHAFAPGIHHMEVSEWTDQLTLIGDFGSVQGQAFIHGTEVAIVSWAADRVVCVLPRIGQAGACGPVFVKVDERSSNTRWLTLWTTQLSLQNTVAIKPGLKMQGATTLYHRADIGKTRDTPGQAPQQPVRDIVAARDSVLALTAGGSYSELDCTITWSGANVAYPAIPDAPAVRVLYAHMKVDAGSRAGKLGLALGAAPNQTGFQTTSCQGGSHPLAPQGFGLLEDVAGFVPTEGEGVFEQVLPALDISFNPDYSIASRSFTDEDGEVVVSISGGTVKFAPSDDDVI